MTVRGLQLPRGALVAFFEGRVGLDENEDNANTHTHSSTDVHTRTHKTNIYTRAYTHLNENEQIIKHDGGERRRWQ